LQSESDVCDNNSLITKLLASVALLYLIVRYFLIINYFMAAFSNFNCDLYACATCRHVTENIF